MTSKIFSNPFRPSANFPRLTSSSIRKISHGTRLSYSFGEQSINEKEEGKQERRNSRFLFRPLSHALSRSARNWPLGSSFPLFIVLLMNRVCNSKTSSRPGLLFARDTLAVWPCTYRKVALIRQCSLHIDASMFIQVQLHRLRTSDFQQPRNTI